MNVFLKFFLACSLVLVSAILLSVVMVPVVAQASTITYGAFNAPWGSEQGVSCAQPPVLIASGLSAGQIITVTGISGSDCPRLYPRSGSCVNNESAGCSEDGHSNLVYPGDSGGFDSLNKVGFYNGKTLIQEVNLTQLQSGYAVPSGATSAYVYFKDTVGDGNDYFDNNGGYKVTFNATVSPVCTPNSTKQCSGNSVYWYDSCGKIGSLYQACTSSQTCTNAQCVNNPGSITVIAPTGDAWTAGNQDYFKWSSTGVSNVNITLINNNTGASTTIVGNIPAITAGTVPPQGNYLWTTPTTFTAGFYTVKIINSSDASVYGTGQVQIVANCTPNATKACVGNAVYNFNSCGVQGTLYQQCASTQTCSNAQCVNNCTPNATKACVGNAVYNFDSCGTKGTLYQQCTSSQTCTNAQCINNCTPNATKACVGNAVYNFDSCGVQGTLYQQCTSNQTCQNGACVNQNNQCAGNTINLSQASNVTVKFVSSSASYNDAFGVSSPINKVLGYGHSTAAGTQFTLSQIPAGEIIFDLSNGVGQTWYTGPASRNADNRIHANVCSTGSNQWTISWEDEYGGGDGDFNDVVLSVSATPACTPNATKACVGNAVYNFDSCGTKGTLYQQCTSSQTCTNAQCINNCTPNATKACVGNAVYNFDSCGVQGTLYQQCTSNQTCQNGQCVNIACSTSSQCGANGFTGLPFCQNNNVYQNYITYTCNNPGTASSTCTNATTAQLKTTCGGGIYYPLVIGSNLNTVSNNNRNSQTCQNGQCVNIVCSTNSQCGANGVVGNPFCQNNNVYQNYITYTCNNPGTASSTCTNATTAQLKTTCTGNQTCSGGTCITSCTPNSTKQCSGNSVYWYDSCGQIGSLYQACTSSQTCSNAQCVNNCTPNATKACVGNAVYNFDSCGVQGTLYQQCTSNQTCSNASCTTTCTPHTSQKCVGNAIYWFDSCGTQQDLVQQCTSNQTCQNNVYTTNGNNGYSNQNYYDHHHNNNPQCVNSCTLNATKQCVGNAVYNFDSCGVQGTLYQQCTSSQSCSNAQCVNSCTPNATKQCSGNSVYWYDSCGQIGSLYQACTSTQTCTNAQCITSCTPNATKQCVGNAVYNFDSCGVQGTLYQQCTSSQSCSNAQCVNSCTNHDHLACVGTNVYWFDSCGTQQELAQDCGFGTCQSGQCILNSFSLSCATNPTQAYVNQSVAYNAFIVLPNKTLTAAPMMAAATANPTYTYAWTGACTGSSSVCTNSFSSAGTQVANLSVTVGTVTKTASCFATIFSH